jgi:hypothetical protein
MLFDVLCLLNNIMAFAKAQSHGPNEMAVFSMRLLVVVPEIMPSTGERNRHTACMTTPLLRESDRQRIWSAYIEIDRSLHLMLLSFNSSIDD